MQQPTVWLKIGPSYCALAENGEVLETVEVVPGTDLPNWEQAGVADYRGAGGKDGFAALYLALKNAERCAMKSFLDIVRLPA